MIEYETSSKQGPADEILIAEALEGNKKSLQGLIQRYQPYIFNLSLRFVHNEADALDITQEVLIKLITHLNTFRGKSKFSTWVYRITLNQLRDTAVRPTEKVLHTTPDSFSGFSYADDSEVDYSEAEVEEVRLQCSTAMLMCLNREQRLLYIVGDIFEADHKLGASLFDLSPANYRVKLHRARKELQHFVVGKCGLVDSSNPCRCPKKARMLYKQGILDRDTRQFNRDYDKRIRNLVQARKNEVSDDIQLRMKELFQDSPFQIKVELDQLLESLLENHSPTP